MYPESGSQTPTGTDRPIGMNQSVTFRREREKERRRDRKSTRLNSSHVKREREKKFSFFFFRFDFLSTSPVQKVGLLPPSRQLSDQENKKVGLGRKEVLYRVLWPA